MSPPGPRRAEHIAAEELAPVRLRLVEAPTSPTLGHGELQHPRRRWPPLWSATTVGVRPVREEALVLGTIGPARSDRDAVGHHRKSETAAVSIVERTLACRGLGCALSRRSAGAQPRAVAAGEPVRQRGARPGPLKLPLLPDARPPNGPATGADALPGPHAHAATQLRRGSSFQSPPLRSGPATYGSPSQTRRSNVYFDHRFPRW